MRMRKLMIRSNRAPSFVRLKLVELGVLPSNCPVCGLISVRQLVELALSYGLEPPSVIYNVFLKDIIIDRKPQQLSQQEDMSDDSLFLLDPSHATSSSSSTTSYGIVPYLTSTLDSRYDDSSDSLTSPNVIMTSLGTKATKHIHLTAMSTESTPASLIVSIARKHVQFNSMQAYHTDLVNKPNSSRQQLPLGNKSKTDAGSHGYSGSRGKVLLNLAKKISQKSKQYSNLNSMKTTGQNRGSHAQPTNTSSTEITGTTRTCPSCGHVNLKHKKRCTICNDFIVGSNCPSCSVLNYFRAKTCHRCGYTMPTGWGTVAMTTAPSMAGMDGLKEATTAAAVSSSHVPDSRGTLEGTSSHPTSPSSPIYTAPPIRNAVLKSLFPQVRLIKFGCVIVPICYIWSPVF